MRPEGRWWDAQYLIPMLGMMLGNACSGVAVGLSAVLDELSTGEGTNAWSLFLPPRLDFHLIPLKGQAVTLTI